MSICDIIVTMNIEDLYNIYNVKPSFETIFLHTTILAPRIDFSIKKNILDSSTFNVLWYM